MKKTPVSEPETTEPALAQLAHEFETEPNLDRLREIAVSLARPGATSKVATLPGFRGRVSALTEVARTGEPLDRLKALAILMRLRRQAKKLESQIVQALSMPSEPLSAPSTSLPDPTDRLYLAQSLAILQYPGRDRYLAEFVASEGQSRTDARIQATIALIRAAPSLTAVFRLLGDAHKRQVHETRDPGTSRARKLVRTLEALGEALRISDPIADASVGPAFAQFIELSLGDANSTDRASRIDVCRNALEVLLGFARPNFSLVRYPETFDVVRTAQRLFGPAKWPSELQDSLTGVAKLLREATALLAQAGITDSRLRDLISLVIGEHQARVALASIALETPGIRNEVRHWLETGRAPVRIETEEAVGETILESVDRDIALIFRAAVQLELSKQRIQDQLIDSSEQYSSALAEETRTIFRRIDEIAAYCRSISHLRNLELRLSAGEVVEYSPHDHDSDRPVVGARQVRIVAPQVVRRVDGRAPRVVLKARVIPNE